MTAANDPWHRWVELAVYAPIGVVTSLQEDLPRHIRQGRQALENRIVLARWIGQMVVQQGRKELAKQLAASRPAHIDDVEAARASADTAPAPDDGLPEVAEPAGVVDPPVAAPVEPAADAIPTDDGPSADALPIEGYESLAALHVVQRLAGLNADELELVRRFEASNRNRRTILAKVAQLQNGDS